MPPCHGGDRGFESRPDRELSNLLESFFRVISMNPDGLSANNLADYFPDITSSQIELLERFVAELIYWNSQINLISRNDVPHLWERHIFHALAIAQFAYFEPGTAAVDIGSGGGIPGIPLAILHPSVNFTLVDSIGKKTATITKITRELSLKNVTVVQERIENHKVKYDYLLGRAVMDLELFYEKVKHCILKRTDKSVHNAGIWYLRGPDFSQTAQNIPLKTFALKQLYPQNFFETKLLVYIPTYN